MAIAMIALSLVALILGIVVFRKNREISALLEQAGKLEEKAVQLSTLYSSIPDLMFSKDLDSVYTACNSSFEKFAGMPESELIGKRDIDVFKIDREMAELFIQADQRVVRDGHTERIEERITFPDGAQRDVETLKTPMYKDGDIIGMMGISRDITERKAAEKAKSHFLAQMSHEIRTPLNAIIGLSQVVIDSIDNRETALDYMDKVLTSSHHLLGILNDVLDFSKIESGKMDLFHSPFSLMDACSEIDYMIGDQCRNKNLKYISNTADAAGLVIVGDKLRISQVLMNLLSNAAKFTYDGGEVEFKVLRVGETDDDVTLSFEVRDTGIGIEEKQFSRLFQAFDQADNTISNRFGGTGLGLSISQNLVRQMGGKIEIESEHGVGSRFFFMLRLPKGELPPQQEVKSYISSLSDKRILLVEDIEVNRLVITAMLNSTGVSIDEAECGAKAIEKFSSSNPGYYDMIFMDVKMPDMDGYETTKAIRQLPHPQAKEVPIIALTANSYKEDVEAALSSGMNGHLAKPVEYHKLAEAINSTLFP